MKNVVYNRDLPVKYAADVLVAGGGPAGCAAAVAAARLGADVLLIEGQACLGGQGTAGLVPAFMQFGDGEHFLAGGFGLEILERMWRLGGEEYEKKQSYAIKAEALKRAYDEILGEAGVRFSLCTHLADAVMDGDEIACCILSAKSGMFAARASIYIDCTGDGDLAAMAGAPWEKGDGEGRMMAGTLCSLWTGIDWQARKGNDRAKLEQAIQDGVFTKPDLHLPGMWKISTNLGGGNIGHTFEVDGTDEVSLTEALVWGRKLIGEYERYYKGYLTGFERMELAATGSMLGIRETRRITGAYVLTLDDFVSRAVFDDEIGRYCYPVDIHASDNSAASFDGFYADHMKYRYAEGESYGVPYRILVPKRVGNLLVAGRCVSADRAMQSSIRVMPGCYITGQAAGVAAALCVRGGTKPAQADVCAVQRRLKETGMYLPHLRG